MDQILNKNTNNKNETSRRLIAGYNHSFHIIMNYPRHCSGSGMFVVNDVLSFNELWRKSIYSFRQPVENSHNKVINTIASTSLLSSQLENHLAMCIIYFTGYHEELIIIFICLHKTNRIKQIDTNV